MFAPEFDYQKASSVADATELLSANGGAKLIAGGQSLIPLLKLRFARPTALIDIGGITDLKSITVDDGTVRIGALATHWDIASSKEVEPICSMLGEWPEASVIPKYVTEARLVATWFTPTQRRIGPSY